MKCEYCATEAKTRVPQPMCTSHAEEFWRNALAFNRLQIERQAVAQEMEVALSA